MHLEKNTFLPLCKYLRFLLVFPNCTSVWGGEQKDSHHGIAWIRRCCFDRVFVFWSSAPIMIIAGEKGIAEQVEKLSVDDTMMNDQ